jgi:hypothetical protein
MKAISAIKPKQLKGKVNKFIITESVKKPYTTGFVKKTPQEIKNERSSS